MYFLTKDNEKISIEEILIDLKLEFVDGGYEYGYNISRKNINKKIQGKIIFELENEEELFEIFLKQLKSSLHK